MRFFGTKRSASVIAEELARVALDIKPEHAGMIAEAAADVSIQPDKIQAEYLHFMVYMVETATQNATSNQGAGEYLLNAYREAITVLATRKGYGTDFWHEQAKRIPIYDEAWQDIRGVGPGVAMATALADQIGGDDRLPLLALSLYGMNLLAPLTKYLRKLRIVCP